MTQILTDSPLGEAVFNRFAEVPTPKISVVIPVYNKAAAIQTTLESVTSQKLSVPFEVVVVDDGSRDQSGDLIRNLAQTDARIRYFFQENVGVSVARNYDVECSRGEWIVFLDADDLFLPGGLQELYQTVKMHDDIDFACANFVRRGTISSEDENTNYHKRISRMGFTPVFPTHGNNNTIEIGENVVTPECNTIAIGTSEFPCDKANFSVGKSTQFNGANFRLMEDGSKIEIGKNCLFSWDVEVYATDSHSILNEAGEVTNLGRQITIGDHVWVGMSVKIGKNVTIGSNCIIGWGSIVTKEFSQENCIIAGNPARVVKTNVNWNHCSSNHASKLPSPNVHSAHS